MLVGQYHIVSFTLNTLGIQREPAWAASVVEPTHLRFPPVGLTAVHNTGFLEVVRRAAERDERQEMTSCECSLLLPERGDLPIGGRSDSNKSTRWKSRRRGRAIRPGDSRIRGMDGILQPPSPNCVANCHAWIEDCCPRTHPSRREASPSPAIPLG
jgi:hypothetical protein